MSSPPPFPRPLTFLAIAFAVLAAHGLVLVWLAHSPTTAQMQSQTSVQWVQLDAASPPPAVQPPAAAPPRPTAAPRARPAHPAHPSRPETPPVPARVHPPPRLAAASPPPTPAPRNATTPQSPAASGQADAAAAPAPAASATPPPPAPATTTGGHAAPVAVEASAAPAHTPVAETAASYTADYLDNPPPPYPRLSRQLGEEGTALLKVQVGPDGRALQVKLLSSTGYPRLDEAAITTVERWRFVAATRNGQAITSWVLVPIKFRIIN
ncbi:energy transducer TonB [Thiomonas sp.]|uniref:energy transducer TonB n=1 Tax=Thiomonas sp. TaxID=2047785 RepID=UPI00261F90F9|nr:energy transducer TonB [Thiomonas sp.]